MPGGGDRAGIGVATGPGRRLLVLDDHDFTRRGKVAQAGFDAEWMTACRHRSAFTHVPLGDVPAGTVNVQGALHNNEPLRSGLYVNNIGRLREVTVDPSCQAVQTVKLSRCSDAAMRDAGTDVDLSSAIPISW